MKNVNFAILFCHYYQNQVLNNGLAQKHVAVNSRDDYEKAALYLLRFSQETIRNNYATFSKEDPGKVLGAERRANIYLSLQMQALQGVLV